MPTFLLKIKVDDRQSAIRALRILLKRLWRPHKIKCTSAVEVADE
jgi:hypothetical protein